MLECRINFVDINLEEAIRMVKERIEVVFE
jgi:hypothetical protein